MAAVESFILGVTKGQQKRAFYSKRSGLDGLLKPDGSDQASLLINRNDGVDIEGAFIAARISKLGGSTDKTRVVLKLDGQNTVLDTTFLQADQLGLRAIDNPYGVIYHRGLRKGRSHVKSLTIGFAVPLYFQSRLEIFITVDEPGVTKVEAVVVFGNDSSKDQDPPGSGNGGEGEFP